MPRRPHLPLGWPGRKRREAQGPVGGWPSRGRRRAARGDRPAPTGRFMLGRAPAPAQGRTPRARLAWLTWRRFALAVLVLLILPGAGIGGWHLVWGDTFRVQEIRIDGLEVAQPLAVAAAADADGASLLWFDDAEVARRIEELPAVREALVSRDWPNGLSITVIEEQGWGYWQRGDTRNVIDSGGRVLTHARPPDPGAVTIFEIAAPSGPTAGLAPDPDTVQLVDRLLTDGTFVRLRVRPGAFVFDPDRGLTVVIEDGPNALLGDSNDYEFKVVAWGALLDRIERDQLEVTEIDLRFGRRMVLR